MGSAYSAPNDLVFDQHGGFYFSDLGYTKGDITAVTAVYYALADGSAIRQVSLADSPNGVGLSPDGMTLYWNKTPRRADYARSPCCPWDTWPHLPNSHYQFTDGNALDSLAIDGDGNICVAVLGGGAIGVRVTGWGITRFLFDRQFWHHQYLLWRRRFAYCLCDVGWVRCAGDHAFAAGCVCGWRMSGAANGTRTMECV
jgi:gluconolactonase